MSYENPEVPHEVNVARDEALVDFLRLLAGVGRDWRGWRVYNENNLKVIEKIIRGKSA